MKNRLGIIGPQDSVDLIFNIAKEFKETIKIVPFIYSAIEESKEFVNDHRDEVDVWLFSGQAPFAIAKHNLNPQSGFYPSLSGSSLTKVLLDISYKDQKELTRLSFDTIPSDQVYETFSELDLQTDKLKLFPYSGYKPTKELVKFHYELFKTNKVDSCITCVHSVYKELKKMNVPTYRLTATKMAIRETILMASQRSEIIQVQSSQISILVLQLYDMNTLISEKNVSFDAHRLSLSLQEMVIEFAEKIQGSFIQQGIEKFVIFSTRGSLVDFNNTEIFDLLEKIKMITKLPANIGIGYGYTVLEAEQNAYIALNHANYYEKNSIMLADERGNVEGPLKNNNSISFNRRTNNTEILERLKLSGVNVGTYNKVLSVQTKLRQGHVHASNLAKWLGMTPRNARRILSDLEKNGLASIVGEESPNARGRPRRIFKVGLVDKEEKRSFNST